MTPASNRHFRCGHCDRTYSTSSHLRRHEATHINRSSAVCPSCNRNFIRSDVLLRHSRTCKQNTNRPTAPGRPGRKRKACNACIMGKVACDGDLPCESCLFKHQDCSYAPVPEKITSTSSVESANKGVQGTEFHHRVPISFLLNYTDPNLQSSGKYHRQLAWYNARASGLADKDSSHEELESDQFSETWPSLFHTFINTAALDPPSFTSGLSYGLDDAANLSKTIDRIILHLEKASKPYSEERNFDQVKAREVFSHVNINRFVSAFFEIAYNEAPFIHKGSFNVNTVSTHLLLTIILFGANCLSQADTSSAEEYYDMVEYSAFESPEFRQLLYGKNPQICPTGIQLIQASTLIIILQSSKPELEAKRRVRVQRMPALVSVVRSLNLTRVVNEIVLDDQMSNIDEYIYQETLVRLMSWIYLLDTHLVVFYHSPPQFRIFEAHFGLPQNDLIFDAVDPAEHTHTTLVTKSEDRSPTLQSVVQYLMADKPIRSEVPEIRADTLFAQFLILSALHCMLFNLQELATYTNNPDALRTIDHALDRWKTLWDLFQCSSHRTPDTTNPGFMVNSLEFWWLAKMLAKQPRIFDGKGEIAADSVDSFHDMIRDLGETEQSNSLSS